MLEAEAQAQPAPGTARSDALFLRACRGERLERVPVWIMRQAGRYLPEYRAIRNRYDFLTCCRTPEIACEITLQPLRRLGVDAAILFSDILIPLRGMGVEVRFAPGPQLDRPVRTAADVAKLRVADARETTPFVLETIGLLRSELPTGVPLIGFAGAPFTMMAYLVEGGGSRSFDTLKALLYREPTVAHQLLRLCSETVISYLTEQVRAGAQAAMIFDTWAGLLSPDDVRTFALPYARHIFAAVKSAAPRGTEVPTIYYGGESAGWLEACREIGADVIGLDWRVQLDAARLRLGPEIVVQGNLDPAVLLGPPESIRPRVESVLRSGNPGLAEAVPLPAGGHIFNLGHGILPHTPPDHARLVVDSVREMSVRQS